MPLSQDEYDDMKRLVSRLTKAGAADAVALAAIRELTTAIRASGNPDVVVNVPKGEARTWTFRHRYDDSNRIKETVATPS